MKRVFLYIILLNLLVTALLCLPSVVMAQIGDPGCNPDNYRCVAYDNSVPPICTDWVLCPIDNGVYILLAFGILYGVKKYFDSRKVKQANSL